MEKKMIRFVILGALVLTFLSVLAVRIWAEPFTWECPFGDGVGVRDDEPCSVSGTAIVCGYIHRPDVGPPHHFRARIQ